ncbi:MAG: DUF2314 domain-containing protein [Planctomycetes bacterium]|nr:DUF2314 domain-containing protein [Planctomycetota bacterium]
MPLAVTLLLDRPAELDIETARRALAKVMGEEAAKGLEMGPKTELIHCYMAELKDRMVMFNVARVTYVPPAGIEQHAAEIADPAARAAFRAHKGFVSVDFVGGTDLNPEEAYAMLGKIACELIDDTCIAVLPVALDTYLTPSDELKAAMRTGETLKFFLDRIVEMVRPDDGAMNEAIKTARTRWPEFVEVWRTSQGNGGFLVKAKFERAGKAEHMWVQLESIKGETLRGKLLNRPVVARELREGQIVEFAQTDVSDWLYAVKGKAEGAFTDPRMRPR